MDVASELVGKVAFVTGAASGIGEATARELARRGVRLVLLDRDAEPLHELAARLGPEVAVAAVADVCDLDAVRRAVAAGVDRFGNIDIVLANAGMGSYGSVAQTDPATFARVIEVNLIGTFNTVRAALPSVLDSGGYILIVSSMAAFLPAAGMAAYSAAKAGSEHFATALRLELAPFGVAVGSAHMLWIDTPLLREGRADVPAFAEAMSRLPGPLGKTLPVDVCVDAFVRAMATRKRRVYVPRWAGVLSWTKPLTVGRAVERAMVARLGSTWPELDRQTAALGRSTSIRTVPAGPEVPR